MNNINYKSNNFHEKTIKFQKRQEKIRKLHTNNYVRL